MPDGPLISQSERPGYVRRDNWTPDGGHTVWVRPDEAAREQARAGGSVTSLNSTFASDNGPLACEQRLLGTLLMAEDLAGDILKEVSPVVAPEDFFEGPDGLHACMFRTIVEAAERGEAASSSKLQARYAEALAVVAPGRNYLIDLMDAASPLGELPSLARMIAGFGVQRRMGQLFARPGAAELEEIDEALRREAQRTSSALTRTVIKAKRFNWIDPSDIEPRAWVYGRHYIRRYLSGTLAPGGFGKSSHSLVEAVAMVSGRPLLGVHVREPLRVWYWNGEDDLEETQRKVAAICLHYGLRREDIQERLYLGSGREDKIVVASETRDGAVVMVPVIEQLIATVKEEGIDVVILDPFVTCHAVSENDNNKITTVMESLIKVAHEANCSIDLVHHVKKGGSGAGGEVTVADGRGASAFNDRVRANRVLNRISTDEANAYGVPPEDAVHLFKIDQGKANLAARSSKPVWRRMVSVGLGNGRDGGPEDKVGVATLWSPEGSLDVSRSLPKLTDRQQVIVRALKLMLDEGQCAPAPSVPGVPPGTLAVKKSELKPRAVGIGYADGADKPETIKRQFDRDITALVSKERVRVADAWVWLL